MRGHAPLQQLLQRSSADLLSPFLSFACAALGRVAVRLASGRGAAPMVVMGKGPKKGKTKDEEASLYKDTVNLPQTTFGALRSL